MSKSFCVDDECTLVPRKRKLETPQGSNYRRTLSQPMRRRFEREKVSSNSHTASLEIPVDPGVQASTSGLSSNGIAPEPETLTTSMEVPCIGEALLFFNL